MGMTAAAVFFITADYYSVTNPVIYLKVQFRESSGFGRYTNFFGMDAERHRKNQQQKNCDFNPKVFFQGNHPFALLPDIVFQCPAAIR